MIQIITISILLAVFNYCYVQYYHNAKKGVLNGAERFIMPFTFKRSLLFFVMLILMLGLAIYIEQLNTEESIWFVTKRICCLGLLFPSAVIDFRDHKIPNKLLFIYICLRIVVLLFEGLMGNGHFMATFLDETISVIFVLGITLLCRLIVKNGICMGDIKMMALMAMFLGSQSLINALFVSLWICFFEAIGLMVWKKKSKKDAIAFAPSVLMGTIISVILTGY